MVEIPRGAVDYLTRQVNALSSDSQERLTRVLRRLRWTPDNIEECREAVSEAARMVCAEYAALSAQAAADFYDAARMLSVGEALGALALPGYDPAATDGAIRAFAQKVVDGKGHEMFDRLVLDRVDYELKLAANRCVVNNGRRDPLKPKYARVPTGAETCDFCLMLASRGFVYRSESSATANHVHSGCDCRIVAGWPGDTVEGYDPDAEYDRWQEALDAKARERAERNGTTEREEYDRIMRSYGDAAKRAKRRNGRA